MIGYLEGEIVANLKDGILLKCDKIGYKVATLTETKLKEVGLSLDLWTYLAVRENALDLYGFENKEELSMFELLLTVSGIGPKSALSTLDATGVESLKRSIIAGNPDLLSKTSGIGKKTAEKIVLELKGKIEEDGQEYREENGDIEAIEALVSLGYSERSSRDALSKVENKKTSTADLIKQALKNIQ